MAWTKYNYAIAFLMIVTGSINTLLTKWADKTSSPGRSGNYNDSGFNQTHPFNHPFLQSSGMVLGEIICLLVFRVGLIRHYKFEWNYHDWDIGPQAFSPFIFLPPALCDVISSSILYTGLTMTTASSFQILRCASIIFTGVLVVIFSRRRLLIYKWIGMVIVLIGLIIVGLSDFLLKKKDSSETHTVQDQTIGYIMIVLAQIFTAAQMILEEKFIGKHNVPPLQAVGWEGVFGLVIIILIIIPFNFIQVGRPFGKPPNGVLEDPIDGFVQIGNSWQILLATLGNIISIAFFNFAGITVTKELAATTRIALDSVRMIVVWMFALAIGWETFTYLQPIGLIFLVIGMIVYNDGIFRPFLIRKGWFLEFTPEETKNLLDKNESEIQSPD